MVAASIRMIQQPTASPLPPPPSQGMCGTKGVPPPPTGMGGANSGMGGMYSPACAHARPAIASKVHGAINQSENLRIGDSPSIGSCISYDSRRVRRSGARLPLRKPPTSATRKTTPRNPAAQPSTSPLSGVVGLEEDGDGVTWKSGLKSKCGGGICGTCGRLRMSGTAGNPPLPGGYCTPNRCPRGSPMEGTPGMFGVPRRPGRPGMPRNDDNGSAEPKRS